ncbi:MAG: outer membrane protein transport protein, partial [Thermoguttaceae bacterium]|nr:outer membrane protein transport protein [Thermoguttaceae bacterium]
MQRNQRNNSRRPLRRLVFGAAFGAACLAASSVQAQGVALRGIGAVNSGMAGVATATPVDALGALQWNPATISALDSSSMTFGAGLIMADSSVESGITVPTPVGPHTMSGRTESDAGTIPAPHMGMVMKGGPDNPFTLGFSLTAVGGAQTNYPSDPTNPVFNENIGIGRVSSKVELFQMAPTLSYQLTDQISIGFAPTIDIARLIAEPMFFGPQDSQGKWGMGAGT